MVKLIIAIHFPFLNVPNHILKEKEGQKKVKRGWGKLKEEGEREKENSCSPEIKTCCTKFPLKLLVGHGAAVFRV